MIKKFFVKLTAYYSKFLAFGAGLSMMSIFLIIFINSTRRYTAGSSFEWGEELPVYLAIYGVMFGIAWAYLNDQHIRFTILVDFISKSIANKLYMLVDLIMVVTGGFLAYSGYVFAMKRGGIESSGLINSAYELSEFTGIEGLVNIGLMYPYQFAMAFGGVLLVISSLLRFFKRIYEIKEDRVVEVA